MKTFKDIVEKAWLEINALSPWDVEERRRMNHV